MKDFATNLRRESADWVSRGIVSAEQRERLLNLYPDRGEPASRFLGVLSLVGGLLVGLGVILVISANWERIGDWVKIAGLLALLAGAYAGGWALKMRPGARHPKTGEALLMVGTILFLAGIGLVSQIFHLNARPATGLLVWWLGIVLVPLLTTSRGAQLVSLAAFLSWLGMEMGTPGSPLQIVGDWQADAAWLTAFAWFGGRGVALLFLGIALRRGTFQEFAGMHEKWGLLLLHASLYLLGFARHITDHRQDYLLTVALLPGLLLGAFLVGTGFLVWRRNPAEARPLLPWLGLALVPVVAVLLGLDLGDGQWAWSVASWIALFVFDLGLIRAGVDLGREGWVNLAVGFLGLNIITRYFDLFGTMLDGGLLFLSAGVVILVLGLYLERKRRRLLASLREEAA
jgi:uncharacterized membrane protein